MKKDVIYSVSILVLFVLCAYIASQNKPASAPGTIQDAAVIYTPSPTAVGGPTPILFSTFTMLPTVYSSTLPCLGCPPTTTPTLNYAKLGLPSPTSTPTLDYSQLASHYLTPFTSVPTLTAFAATVFAGWTPTSKPFDPLAQVVARQLPQSWRPTAPSAIPATDTFAHPDDPYSPSWQSAYVQAMTDLMNWTNADEKQYALAVDNWSPQGALNFDTSWLLKYDFDSDGQPEWLASAPLYAQGNLYGVPYCCGQMLLLFEKAEKVFRPMYILRVGFWNSPPDRVVLVQDLNNDGYPEIVTEGIDCGTSCSTYFLIGEWDGQSWRNEGYMNGDFTSQVSFLDLYGDGKKEILLSYTASLLVHREVLVTYAWDGKQFSIRDEVTSPG